MFQIDSQQDSAFSRVHVFASQIAVKNNGGRLTPEVLAVALLAAGPNIVTKIMKHMHVDVAALMADLEKAIQNDQSDILSSMDYGTIRITDKSKKIIEAATECYATRKDPAIGVQHLLFAILRVASVPRDVFVSYGVTYEKFKDAVDQLVSVDSSSPKKERVVEGSEENQDKKKMSSKDILNKYCVNLTAQAAAGKLHPIIGRDSEIRRLISTLNRWTKNNAILVGEPGVGKTAVVEGLAQRIVSGTVPDNMKGAEVYALDLAAVLDKTSYRGQFEGKMKSIVEVFSKTPNLILFIDEIHSMLGAGSSVGGVDAANIMKPALASGEIRCIGATTEDEFKKYFKRDGALERRFQRVFVDEPSKQQTISILRGIKDSLEKHHGFQISDAAIEGAVDLSNRYILDRKNPDKSIDCLDEACSYHAFAKPGSHIPPSKIPVTYDDVVCLMAEHSGIDKDVIKSTDLDRAKDIATSLKRFVVGQDDAISDIARILRNAYSGVRDPNRPIGSIVLAGQSGCGKTYLAKKIADCLFPSSSSLITINLAEFTEKHHQSRLLGSPPGYVGFGDRNQLTDKVLRRPYCLVLLDGIESAHPDIVRIFLRAMSEGTLTDAEGREVSFKNALLVMTLGMDFSGRSGKSQIGFSQDRSVCDYEKKKSEAIAFCRKKFGDDFTTRLDEVIPMIDLPSDKMPLVAQFLLRETTSRVANNGIDLTYSSQVPDVVLSMCKDGKNNASAKDIADAIRKNLEPLIAEAVMDGGSPCSISLSVSKSKISAKRIESKMKVRNE